MASYKLQLQIVDDNGSVVSLSESKPSAREFALLLRGFADQIDGVGDDVNASEKLTGGVLKFRGKKERREV